MKWKKERIVPEEVRRLHERYHVDLIVATILCRRGITDPKHIKYVLESDSSFLHNPFLFDDMELFVERVQRAQEEKELVGIIGDRDVDGITSTVLLKQELDSMGIETSFRLPEGDEPYGMTKEVIDEATQQGITLLITVDCGISNGEEIAYALSKGIDTLVVDHHIGGEQLPAAYAIIDPKVSGSGYPFEHLAGCGVVAKCIWALRFAQSDFYHEECLLLHARPGNETVIIEAVKLENLIETDRILEEIVPGVISAAKSKALEFLACGLPVLVLDRDVELQQLRVAFGKSVDIHVTDIRKELEKVMPVVQGKSLFALSQLSRAVRYSDSERKEMDALVSLFQAYLIRNIPGLGESYEKILDLVAIGTIADLMPMIDENRILVRRGLRVLADGTRENLVPLMILQNQSGKTIATSDVSWQITPVINAAGRLGKPQVAAKMLLAQERSECEALASELVGLNKARQKLGEDAWERLLPKAKTSMEHFGSKFVMVEDASISRGITGVMAARLMKQFGVPVLVVASVDETRSTGSMRSPQSFNIRFFLERFDDLLIDYGGHACAGGFSIETKKLEEFKTRLEEEVERMDLFEDEQEDQIRIDAVLPPEYFTPEIISMVEIFEPYGEKNPPLQFEIENATIEELYTMNNKSGPLHVHLTFAFGSYKWPAVFWKAGDRVGEDFAQGDTVDVVFRLGRNYFRNQQTLQLTVLDIARKEVANGN